MTQRVTVVEGSAPLYTSRRAMREAAGLLARDLPVRMAEPGFATPVITVDAPSLGNSGENVPRARVVPRTIAPLDVRHGVDVASSPRGAPRVRNLARRLTAGAALLFIGSLVTVTSLPAQALQPSDGLDADTAEMDSGAQILESVAADDSVYFTRDSITVNDQVAAARMSADERAALQATADAEAPQSSYGGNPAFPQAWSALETSYVQTPFPNLDQLRITSPFGNRAGGFHGGTDIAPGLGTEIRPVANGIVSAVWQGNNPGGGGYVVFIDHNVDGQFVQSWYGHMVPGSIQVEVGQVVDINTVIGQVGSSGVSSGPHVHLEMKNSDYVSFDPMLWLQTREMNLEY